MRLMRISVAALVLAFLCSTAFAETIKIGVVGAHSGDLASYGLPTVNAAKVVTKMVNDNGGINGKLIELLIQDDQCKPELATNAATKVVSDGAVAILGHICSGATKAALPIYSEAKVLTISPSATNPPLTKSGDYPTFFRTIPSDDAQAELVAGFVTAGLKAKKVAILHDKGDYGKGFAEFAQKYLADAGVEIALFEGVTVGAVDYSAVIQKIRRAKVDAVIYGGYHPEASKLVTQLRKKRVKVPFVSDDGVKDETFIKVAGKNSEGVYASGPQDVSMLSQYKQAVAAHKEMFNSTHGAFYINAYAAMQTLVNALKKAKATDFDSIANVMRSDMVDTSVGKIKFDAKGDAIGVGFTMFQVQNGKYVELK